MDKRKQTGMAKYHAKRFFNVRAKRFWATAAAPFLFMAGGPVLESNTVDDYREDVTQADTTMTENMDSHVAEYLATTKMSENLSRDIYFDRYAY